MHRNAFTKLGVLVAIAIGVVSVAARAEAATIFSAFDVGDLYTESVGWTLALDNPTVGANLEQGERFTPLGHDFSLDRVELAAGLVQGPNELDVRVMDDAGGVPGNILEAFHFSGAMGPFGSLNPPLAADSLLHPVLTEGTPYWLIGAPSHSGTWTAWNFNSIGSTGAHALRANHGPWVSADVLHGAFRISGTPLADGVPVIPEPRSLILLGLGVFALIRRRPSRI